MSWHYVKTESWEKNKKLNVVKQNKMLMLWKKKLKCHKKEKRKVYYMSQNKVKTEWCKQIKNCLSPNKQEN